MKFAVFSLASERFRTVFFVFYALSCLFPTLVLIFIFYQYIHPILTPDQVELVMLFEDEFKLDIPDEDAEKIRTIGNAVSYIGEKS